MLAWGAELKRLVLSGIGHHALCSKLQIGADLCKRWFDGQSLPLRSEWSLAVGLGLPDPPGYREDFCHAPKLKGQFGMTAKAKLLESISLDDPRLNTLSPRCRQMVTIRRTMGLSQADMAECLGISKRTYIIMETGMGGPVPKGMILDMMTVAQRMNHPICPDLQLPGAYQQNVFPGEFTSCVGVRIQ